uniref:Uncharacterized protein n=1 Tax=Romanomermis culicivorax TaxID=13658 RepID=A0A915KSJ1_ROMCU
MGAVSDQFQAQQLCIQCKIQEQTKATNAHFAILAELMQQLISTTAAANNARNRPTPRQLLVSSRFHETKNYPPPHLKDANRLRPTISASWITRRTTTMTTRNLGTKCRLHLIGKRIAASEKSSTICTR